MTTRHNRGQAAAPLARASASLSALAIHRYRVQPSIVISRISKDYRLQDCWNVDGYFHAMAEC
jgi:hypothetical protein